MRYVFVVVTDSGVSGPHIVGAYSTRERAAEAAAYVGAECSVVVCEVDPQYEDED
jgi:hypothetical protein